MPDQPTIPDEAIEAFVEAFRRSGAWGSECVRAGLTAALPHLAPTVRAQVADEIAKAIRHARDGVSWLTDGEAFAYDHSEHLARALRVPDCGDRYHGADGGPCGGCGFDVAAVTSSDQEQR